MKSKEHLKEKGIILIVTSFNQIYNFLSFFLTNKTFANKKIYLTIFSDHIPEELIHLFQQYLNKFSNVEILDMRRNFLSSKFKVLNKFFYYFFFLKKIIKIKKKISISYILISGRMQIPVLSIMHFFRFAEIYLIEDGAGEYVPYSNEEKKNFFFLFIFLNIIFKKNKSRLRVLQLAKSKKDYFRILGQPYLDDKFYINNREAYKKFLKDNFNESLLFKPKCIIIGTLPSKNRDLNIIKDYYLQTIYKIKREYNFKSEDIIFFPHPRTNNVQFKELSKSLSIHSIIHPISSIIVENYLFQKNLEVVVGSLSSALYYSKTIFDKDYVFYLENRDSLKKDEKDLNFMKTFENVGIKSFFWKGVSGE